MGVGRTSLTGGALRARGAGAAVCVHLALGSLLFRRGLLPAETDFVPMIVGEALRTGQGYHDIYLPGAPLHWPSPPLYPLLLAGLGALAGPLLFRAASLAISGACVWLAWRLARRYVSVQGAVVAAWLVALSPLLLEHAHAVGSATLLLLFTLLALNARGRPAAGVYAALAFLTDPRALALLVAVPIREVLCRRPRAALAATGAVAGVVGGWWLYGQLTGASGAVPLWPFASAQATGGMAEGLRHAAVAAWTYASGTLTAYLDRSPFVARRFVAAALAVTLTACLGLTRRIGGWPAPAEPEGHLSGVAPHRAPPSGLGLAEPFTLLYALGCIVAFPGDPSTSYLLPILPLLVAYGLEVTEWLGSHAGLMGTRHTGVPAVWRNVARSRRLLAPVPTLAYAALLIGPAMALLASTVPARVACMRSNRTTDACVPAGLADFQAAARWSSDSLPEAAIVASRSPSMFYGFSGRRGVPLRLSGEPALVMASLASAGANYVLIDRVDSMTSRRIAPVVQENRQHFVTVYAVGQPPTLLLRFEPAPMTALAAGPGRPAEWTLNAAQPWRSWARLATEHRGQPR